MGSINRALIGTLTGAFAIAFAPSEAAAHGQQHFGTLSTEQVECGSLCTAGPLTGGLAGQLEFTRRARSWGRTMGSGTW
jgi:hypothetical protein